MGRYKSRATRAGIAAVPWREVAKKARGFLDAHEEATCDLTDHDAEEFDHYLDDASDALQQVDAGDAQELCDEIQEWRCNMEGTNLENTDKYEELQECESTLEDIIGRAEGLDTDLDAGTLREAADELDGVADELEEVEFPGMYR